MFPLSQSVIYVLEFATFAAFCTICFLLAAKSKLFALPALGVFAACSAWLLLNSNAGWDALGALMIVGALFILMVISGLWAYVSYRIYQRNTPVRQPVKWPAWIYFLGASPAIIYATFALGYQYVPPSKCSTNSIQLTIGEGTYTLLREYKSIFRIPTDLPYQSPQFNYSYAPEHKISLKSICHQSRNGKRPIIANQLWLEPETFQVNLGKLCNARLEISASECAKYSGVEWSIYLLEDTGFTSYLYGSIYTSIHNIAKIKDEPNVVAYGDQYNGYLCRQKPSAWGADCLYCYKWRAIDPMTILVVSSHETLGIPPMELLKMFDSAMDASIEKLLQ